MFTKQELDRLNSQIGAVAEKDDELAQFLMSFLSPDERHHPSADEKVEVLTTKDISVNSPELLATVINETLAQILTDDVFGPSVDASYKIRHLIKAIFRTQSDKEQLRKILANSGTVVKMVTDAIYQLLVDDLTEFEEKDEGTL